MCKKLFLLGGGAEGLIITGKAKKIGIGGIHLVSKTFVA